MVGTALITGTTSGIGRALSIKLALEGYRLILVARNDKLLKEQASELRLHGIEVLEIVCDLSQPDASGYILNQIEKAKISIDMLVNNAGFNEAGEFTETDLKKELAMILVHIVSLTELTKGLLPDMLKAGSGKILNIASTGAYMACPYDAVYAATKAYVLSFSNALYQELKGSGVTVTALSPGATKTAFADKAGMNQSLLFRHFVMSAEKVAEAGYQSVLRGKRNVTPGIYNKLLVACTKFLPVGILSPLAQIMVQK